MDKEHYIRYNQELCGGGTPPNWEKITLFYSFRIFTYKISIFFLMTRDSVLILVFFIKL